MKKLIILSCTFLAAGYSSFGQGADEAFQNLRSFYNYSNYGSARAQAMGGAFTSLGGDISNTFINPAGLGFYNRSEVSGTFNFLNTSTNATYIGNTLKESKTPLEIGHLGLVFSNNKTGSRMKRGAFGVAYNNLSNLNSQYSYEGSNNNNTIADVFLGMARADNLTPEQIAKEYTDNGGYSSYGQDMAIMGGLLYYNDNTKEYIVGEESLPVRQVGNVSQRGGLGQLNLSYGVNFDHKTYFGGGVGIQFLNYNKFTQLDEIFPGNAQYLSSQYYENENVITGTGINLTLGVIHRFSDKFNLGASITTPTWMSVKDQFYQYAGVSTKTDDAVLYHKNAQTLPNEITYGTTSPMRFNVGGSVFLPKQIGVISVEAEYVGFNNMKIKDKQDNQWANQQNSNIGAEYRDVVNLKAGLEIKHGIGRFRAGVNLVNDPLKYPADYNVRKSYAITSLGVGVRNGNFFADLTYSGTSNRGAFNPYVMPDNTHNSVTYKQSRNNIGVSLGMFF